MRKFSYKSIGMGYLKHKSRETIHKSSRETFQVSVRAKFQVRKSRQNFNFVLGSLIP